MRADRGQFSPLEHDEIEHPEWDEQGQLIPSHKGTATPGRSPLATNGVRRHRTAAPGKLAPSYQLEPAAESQGFPLSAELRQRVESASGASVGSVRIHTGPESQRAASAMGAKAYTQGQDIHFARGQYDPKSIQGQRLLFHEVAHTIQQRGVSGVQQAKLHTTQPGDALETEADAFAHAILGNSRVPGLSSVSTPTIARETEGEQQPEEQEELGLVEGGFVKLIRQVSPTVADLIEHGADNLLQEVFNEGLGTVFEEASGGIDIQQIVAEVMTSMQGMAELISSGDTEACAMMGERLEGAKVFIDEFFASETFDIINERLAGMAEQAEMMRNMFLAPAFEAVMEMLGDRFARIKEIIDAVRSAGAAIQDVSTAAWEWVCEYFGIEASEGGMTEWLMAKAQEIWEKVSAELEPIKEPLMVLGGALAMGTPFGAMMLIKEGLPPLVEGITWLLEHKDDPNLIANAREELGDTWLPLVLERLDWLNTQLAGSLDGALGPLAQLQEALAGVAGVLTGIASGLSGFISAIGEAVNTLITWVSDTWTAISTAIGELTAAAWEAIRPVLAVLSSLAFAIVGFPASTLMVIAGWGWTMLCPCLRVQIVEVLLHLVMTALETVELPGVWGLLQSGMSGFYAAVSARLESDPDGVLMALDNVAMIIAGANPEFILGFCGGLIIGVVEGIFDPLLMIWDILSITVQLQMWAMSMAAGQIGAAMDTAVAMGQDALVGMTEEASQAMTPELMERFAELAATLQPIAEGLQAQFMPAVEALMSGEGMTFEQLMEFFGSMWEMLEGAIAEHAGHLANYIIDLLQDPSGISWDAGYWVGWITGTVLVETGVIAISYGTLEAVFGTSKAVRMVIDALKMADKVLGEAFELIGKFADEALELIQMAGAKLGDLAKGVFGELFELAAKGFDELKKFVDDAIALLFRKGDDVAEEVAEEVVEEVVEGGARHADDVMPDAPGRSPDAPDADAPDAPRTDGPDADPDAPDGDRPKDGDVDDPDADPDGKKDTDDDDDPDGKKDDDEEKKDDDDDTNEKTAARVAAADAWSSLRKYADDDLRTRTEMEAKLATQDPTVRGARITYDLEDSGSTWSVEATARGDADDLAKSDTAGSGWIAKDGTTKYYGDDSAAASDQAIAEEILDELQTDWEELCETVEGDEARDLQTEANRIAATKDSQLKYDRLEIEVEIGTPNFETDEAEVRADVTISPNNAEVWRKMIARGLEFLEEQANMEGTIHTLQFKSRNDSTDVTEDGQDAKSRVELALDRIRAQVSDGSLDQDTADEAIAALNDLESKIQQASGIGVGDRPKLRDLSRAIAAAYTAYGRVFKVKDITEHLPGFGPGPIVGPYGMTIPEDKKRAPDGSAKEGHHVPPKELSQAIASQIETAAADENTDIKAEFTKRARAIRKNPDGKNLTAIWIHRVTHQNSGGLSVHAAALREALEAELDAIEAENQTEIIRVRTAVTQMVAMNPNGKAFDRWVIDVQEALAKKIEENRSTLTEDQIDEMADDVMAGIEQARVDEMAVTADDVGDANEALSELIKAAFRDSLTQARAAVKVALDHSVLDGPETERSRALREIDEQAPDSWAEHVDPSIKDA